MQSIASIVWRPREVKLANVDHLERMTSRELTYRWHTYKLLRADRYVLHHCLAIHATVVRKFGMFCAVLSMARILFCPLFSQKINSQISLNYNTLGANVYKPICGIFSRDDWLKMAASEDAHVFISGHLKWSSLEKYFYKNIHGGPFFFTSLRHAHSFLLSPFLIFSHYLVVMTNLTNGRGTIISCWLGGVCKPDF